MTCSGRRCLVVAALVVLGMATAAPAHAMDAAKAFERYRAGMAAADSGNVEAYGECMREALEYAPRQPVLMRNLAHALVAQGRGDEAVSWLARAAATGVDMGLADDGRFEPLRGRADFQRVLDAVARRRTVIGETEEAFRLDLGDFLPEGIAYDPGDEVFYMGSVRYGKIVRIEADGTVRDFAAPVDMTGAIGLRVDDSRRDLWAVSTMIPGVAGFTEERNGESAVHRFDLVTGTVEAEYLVSNADGVHNFNDIVVASDGTAYVTDSAQGAVYVIHPHRDRLEELVLPGELRGPNGLALSADDRLLYVAQYSWGLAVVDLATRSWEPMDPPDDVVAIGIDGLYRHGHALVGVQNYLGLAQVTRFELSGNGRALVGSRIVARHHPRFEDPTTGAFRGDDFFVIANSQLPRVDTDGTVPPPDTFDDTVILKMTIE